MHWAGSSGYWLYLRHQKAFAMQKKYSLRKYSRILYRHKSLYKTVPSFLDSIPSKTLLPSSWWSKTAHRTTIKHTYSLPWLPCAIVSDTEKSKSYPKHSLSCNSKGLNIIFFQYVTCQWCIVRNSKLCRCNIWQFIYKKNCKEVMAKSAKRGQKWQYRVKSGENWEKHTTCHLVESPPLSDSPTADPGPALNLAPKE